MLHVWNASVERVQVCSLFVICVCVCVCFIQLYIQFSFTNAALVISPSRFTYVSLLHFIVFSQFVSSCVFFFFIVVVASFSTTIQCAHLFFCQQTLLTLFSHCWHHSLACFCLFFVNKQIYWIKLQIIAVFPHSYSCVCESVSDHAVGLYNSFGTFETNIGCDPNTKNKTKQNKKRLQNPANKRNDENRVERSGNRSDFVA